MEKRQPKRFEETVFHPEGGQQENRADQLQQQRGGHDEPGQVHDAAHLGRRDGFLHGAALHEADLLSGNKGQRRRRCHHAQAPHLDQKQDHGLAKGRPGGGGIAHHKPRYADRRSGGKETVRKARASRTGAGKRQHQQQRAQQNETKETERNHLKRGDPAFLHENMRLPSEQFRAAKAEEAAP